MRTAIIACLIALGGVTLYSYASAPDSATESTPSSCLEPNWVDEPRADHGVFEARLSLQCKIASSQTLSQISNRFRTALQNERKQHSPPLVQVNATLYDVSHEFTQDGDHIWLREKVTFLQDPITTRYHSLSQEIDASGLSGYLKELEFTAVFEKETHLVASFETRVKIKRPWFAPAFLFYPIAKAQTKAKIKLQATELARRISSLEESPLP